MQPSGGPQVGQTRPGRLGDPQPGGGGASTAAAPGDAGRAAGDPRKFVDQEIASHKAVVFSKVAHCWHWALPLRGCLHGACRMVLRGAAPHPNPPATCRLPLL